MSFLSIFRVEKKVNILKKKIHECRCPNFRPERYIVDKSMENTATYKASWAGPSWCSKFVSPGNRPNHLSLLALTSFCCPMFVFTEKEQGDWRRTTPTARIKRSEVGILWLNFPRIKSLNLSQHHRTLKANDLSNRPTNGNSKLNTQIGSEWNSNSWPKKLSFQLSKSLIIWFLMLLCFSIQSDSRFSVLQNNANFVLKH